MVNAATGGAAMDRSEDEKDWHGTLYSLLRRHNVTQCTYVPDAGHQVLIDRLLADPEDRLVALTAEKEGGVASSQVRLQE
jgi:hypothetical protein